MMRRPPHGRLPTIAQSIALAVAAFTTTAFLLVQHSGASIA
jgi:hypothetical protein